MNAYEAEVRRHLAEAHDSHPPEEWGYEEVPELHRELMRQGQG